MAANLGWSIRRIGSPDRSGQVPTEAEQKGSEHGSSDDHRARGGAGPESQRDGQTAGRLRPRALAAAEQLGPLGRGLQKSRLRAADAGLARRPRHRRRGQRAPRGLRPQVDRPDRRPLRRRDRWPRQEAGDHRSLLRRPAHPDPRRPRPLRRLGRLRLGPVPRHPAAADLLAEIGQTGAREPGQPRPRRAAHLRPVPLLVRQRLQRGRGQAALQRILRAGIGSAAVPVRERQPQPVDRGEGRSQKPRPRADADRLRDQDHVSPKAINEAIFKKQEKNKGVTELVAIEGGPHGLVIGSDWRKVCGTALEFVQRFV